MILLQISKKGNFYRGLDDATDDIIKAAAGEYKAPAGYHKKGKGLPIGGLIIFLIILFTIFGSRGGGRGGMMSRRGYGNFWTGAIIGSMLGGGLRRRWLVRWTAVAAVVVLADLVAAVVVAAAPVVDGKIKFLSTFLFFQDNLRIG